MNRFEFAIDVATGSTKHGLPALAHEFNNAVEHTEAEGADPLCDPAVLLLGSFIAFHVHADVNTAGGYRTLLQGCYDRAANAATVQ